MDFKLCGTKDGVTGFQLDLKLGGIPLSLMNEAIDQAKTIAHADSLASWKRSSTRRAPRCPQFAPRIETIQINPEKIGLVIGPGGKNIKSIVAETGAEINIEDDGRVKIYSTNGDAMERAKEIILGMVGDIEVGKIYRGRVVTLKDFGAFVEVLPGKDGLVHISEWSDAARQPHGRRGQGRRRSLGQVHRPGRQGPQQAQPQSRHERTRRRRASSRRPPPQPSKPKKPKVSGW